jgi:hypothetical protein
MDEKCDNDHVCAECLEYSLYHQMCGIDSKSRHPFEMQCTEHKHSSRPKEEVKEQLLNLVISLRENVGGKYFTLVPICSARGGICPKGHDFKCENNCLYKMKIENQDNVSSG